ncbi:MAG: hypothetical protein AAFZ07_05045 [Actinomycetota bacterium]
MSAPEIDADIHFYWDPVCPFAWMTSRWIRQVESQREYAVDWRFISLRIINKAVDYDAHFPPEYEQGHTAGLRMLRVAAAVRAERGRPAMAGLYAAMGASVFDVDPPDRGGPGRERLGTPDHVAGILERVGLPTAYADALDDTSWDAELEAETDHALSLTGRDVGTPIISFRPPDGPSFFGPVISRLPSDEDAVALWDSVVHLATFPGFAELKRSLRELPQLRALGVSEDDVGVEQDWHGGSRRLKEDRG